VEEALKLFLKNKKAYMGWAAFGAAIFFTALWLCARVPLYNDDIRFSMLVNSFPRLFDFLVVNIKTVDARPSTAVSAWLVFCNDIWLWRVANAAIITLFCFLVAKIACLLIGKRNIRPMHLLFACASLALLDFIALFSSVFWITGSLNYIWPLTAALLAIYHPLQAALYPERGTAGAAPFYSVLASIYACLAQEQIAAVLAALLVVLTVYSKIKGKIPRFLLVQTALSFAACAAFAFFSFLGPRQATAPVIEAMAFSQRLFIVIQWLSHSYVNYTKYILCILWALLFLRFIRKKLPVYAALSALFCASAIASAFLPFLTDVGLADIQAGAGATVESLTASLHRLTRERPPTLGSLTTVQLCVLAFWLFAVVLTPWMLVKAAENKTICFAAPLLYLGGAASACMMVFAPYLFYSSMGRAFFVTAILLVIIAMLFLPPIEKPKHKLLAALCLLCLMAASLCETYEIATNLMSEQSIIEINRRWM